MPEPPPDAGSDAYAAGIIAFDKGDWQGVIEHMGRVLEQRPWHDNAHNLIGFAYRKLGDYQRALEFYGKALELNPHNRGALEYLGEAYLEMDRPEDAEAMLDRLEVECKRIGLGSSDGEGRSECEEWQELQAAFGAYLAGLRSDQAAR